MVSIRQERKEDYELLYDVDWYAFEEEITSIMVHVLRKTPDYIPELSLVAVKDHKIVGHIVFIPITIKCDDQSVPAVAIALLSIEFRSRNKGVGSKLVWEALRRSKSMGYGIVVVDNLPKYYRRFGFSVRKAKGLEPPFDIPYHSFSALELVPKALRSIHGVVKYPSFFDDL